MYRCNSYRAVTIISLCNHLALCVSNILGWYKARTHFVARHFHRGLERSLSAIQPPYITITQPLGLGKVPDFFPALDVASAQLMPITMLSYA